MSGRLGKLCGPKADKPNTKDDKAPQPAPKPSEDDEEDGDIATPKRDRDDEAE